MNRLHRFRKSMSYAWRGLRYALRNEKNFQNEVGVAVLVVIAMFYFQITRAEMIVLFLVISGVLAMELLNTIMERVVDILKPKVHPYARLIKDIMAAVVLLGSFFAIIIGALIFVPYIIK